MEEFLSFNQHGPFDFSFGCFNSAAIQDMKITLHLLFYFNSTKFKRSICFHYVLPAHASGHSCLYNPSDMCRNEMEVNKKKSLHFFFFLEWSGWLQYLQIWQCMAKYADTNTDHKGKINNKKKKISDVFLSTTEACAL